MNADGLNERGETSDRGGRAVHGTGLKLNETSFARIADHLESHSEQFSLVDKRKEPWFQYRQRSLHVELIQPGLDALVLRVHCWNLGCLGMGFLHGGYLYTGTRCRIQLITVHNNWQVVEGTVVRCEYIEGRVHDIGVKFDHAIDVAAFAPSALPRRILLADDDESFVKLVLHHLKSLNARVVAVSNGEQAISAIDSQVFDLIMMDIEMPVLEGLGAVKQLRDRGYSGSVVAVTALTSAAAREQIMAAGFDGYLAKPITKQSLLACVRQFDQEPLFSSLVQDEGMKDLINDFVAGLHKRIRAIEEAAARKDIAAIGTLSRQLKGEAGSYGFELISVAAEAVEESASDPASLSKLSHEVRQLILLCRLARPVLA